MKTTKKISKPLTEAEKQVLPQKGEVEPKTAFTKISVAASKALILSGIDKKK